MEKTVYANIAERLGLFQSGRATAATVKGHKYSSLSKTMREIFTPVVHTVNRKT